MKVQVLVMVLLSASLQSCDDATQLQVSKLGAGEGLVTAVIISNGETPVVTDKLTLDCGSTCAADVYLKTKYRLTATASPGSKFTGWSGRDLRGGCTDAAPTCEVLVSFSHRPDGDNGPIVVEARFEPESASSLTVSTVGSGSGTVTSTPAGISCGASCSASFPSGTSVTLTATPATGSTFAGWAGAGCSGTGTCAVTLTAAASVTATFTLDSSTVTVAKAGTGSGTVSSAPAGISCGATCAAAFTHGAVVTLTATPATGSTFTGWAGAGCSGTGTCAVTVTAAASVTATFTLDSSTVTVSKAGTGTGTVSSAPAGISCGATCAAAFTYGSVVTLTATPASGSTFAGWSGAGCSGTGPCAVTVTAAATVTATFVLPNYAFVTSSTTTGAMGGLGGADVLCQQRAAAAGLSGTFRAWLSTSTTNAVDRLASANGWRRTDGLPFVNSVADLAAGRILYPLRLDELGVDVFSTTVFATTLGTGVLDGALSTCTDWTSTVSQYPAGTGNPSATTGGWTTGGVATCSSPQRLYCFAIDVQAVAQARPPAQLRRAFVSTAAWTSGGGIGAADTVCANEASAANLPGSYRALLTPLNATAASRFDTSGPPWVRVDDVALATTAAAFFSASFWQAALNVSASGAHGTDVTWSGAANFAIQGSPATTCAGWSSASVNDQAGTGTTSQTEVRFAFGEVTSDDCSQPHKLLCLQQ